MLTKIRYPFLLGFNECNLIKEKLPTNLIDNETLDDLHDSMNAQQHYEVFT